MASTQRWTTILAAVATFGVVADSFGATAALPAIAATYDATPAATRWVVAAHLLALAVLIPLGARLADRFGHRRVLTAGFVVLAAASAGCALAPTMAWLVAARALQGSGSALAVAASRGLWRAAFAIGGRPWIAERAAPGAALLLAPLAAGALAAGPGWRWDFAAEAGIGLAAAVLARLLTAEFHGARRGLGLDGLLVSFAGAAGVAWAVHRAPSGWSWDAIVALAVGCLALAVIVRWETPLGRLHATAFLAQHAASMFLCASISGSAAIVAWALHAAGLSPVAIALPLGLWALVAGVVSEGLVAPRYWGDLSSPRPRRIAAWGLLLHAGALVLLAVLASNDIDRPVVLVPIVFSGAGCGMAVGGRGLAFPQVFGVRRTAPVADQEEPHAVTSIACAGGALGVAVMAGLSRGRPGGAGWPGGHGAAVALICGALLAAAGYAAALAMPVGPAGGLPGRRRSRSAGLRLVTPGDRPPPNTALRSMPDRNTHPSASPPI